jgi:hypothetical protein
MSKKVSFGTKPTLDKPTIDQWVETRKIEPEIVEPEVEKIKRKTNDIPESLHRIFKSKSSAEGKSMGDLIRYWIEDYCK